MQVSISSGRRALLNAGAALSAVALAPMPARALNLFGLGKEPIPAPEDVAAPPANAEVTSTGLASVVLQEGDASGENPTAFDKVRTCQ